MANYWSGFQAKIRINTVAYAGATYQISDDCQDLDVSNTEGIAGNAAIPSNSPSFTCVVQGLRRFTCTIRNATYDSLMNPFQAPFAIFASTYIALRIFLNPTGVSWEAPSFYVNRVGTDGDVKALQPISFSGVGDGAYSVPSS